MEKVQPPNLELVLLNPAPRPYLLQVTRSSGPHSRTPPSQLHLNVPTGVRLA